MAAFPVKLSSTVNPRGFESDSWLLVINNLRRAFRFGSDENDQREGLATGTDLHNPKDQ